MNKDHIDIILNSLRDLVIWAVYIQLIYRLLTNPNIFKQATDPRESFHIFFNILIFLAISFILFLEIRKYFN